MSGDQTSYIRAKMAERGQATATFMKDGFDRWAESEAPAREGQMEKTPADVQMASTGGSMSVAMAKRLAKSYISGGIRVPTTSMGVRKGGRSILGIQIPDEVEKYIGYAEKFVELVNKVSARLPAIKQDLEENVIYNNDDPSIGPKDKEVAKQLLGILQAATGYIATIKKITDLATQIAKLVGSGSGMSGGMRGGKTAVETLTEWINKIKQYGKILADWVGKFSKYKNFIRPMLNLRSLQPEGKLLLERIDPLLQLVGGSGGAKCRCRSSSPPCGRRGGRSITDAVMETVQPPYGTTMYGVAQPSYGYMQPDGKYEEMKMSDPAPTAQKQAALARRQAKMDEEEKRQAEAVENVRRQTAQSVGDVQKDFFRMKGGKFTFIEKMPPSYNKMREANRMKGGASCGGKKPSARGAIVKKVMREQGLSLPQASKYVKEHGLY